jgi:CheY-like chemotaxis protein
LAADKYMDLNKKIVAVVEPNQGMSAALQRFLQTHGYASEVYASAEGFLQRPGGILVDCLILNMDLDSISGMEFHRKLSEHKAAPPVIFVTADPKKSLDTAKLAEGWIACLRMPMELRALRHALATAMGTDPDALAAQPSAVPKAPNIPARPAVPEISRTPPAPAAPKSSVAPAAAATPQVRKEPAANTLPEALAAPVKPAAPISFAPAARHVPVQMRAQARVSYAPRWRGGIYVDNLGLRRRTQ